MSKPSTFAERLASLMEERKLSKSAVAKLCGIDKSNITRYCKGDYEAKQDVVFRIASALNVNPSWLMGYDAPMQLHDDPVWKFAHEVASGKAPDNIIPMPKMNKVPLLGEIACGSPILAEENFEGEVTTPDNVHADFALRCQGDSMINARIFDGDIVYIKQQASVEDGEIAAVLIDDDATLKRVRLFDDHIVLEPENPQYRPYVYWGIDMEAVHILGKAVAFTSIVR